MSADSQILITLREYCRCLTQREAILSTTDYGDYSDGSYQRDLAELDRLNKELQRRQQTLIAWSRGESPVMHALAHDNNRGHDESHWRHLHDQRSMMAALHQQHKAAKRARYKQLMQEIRKAQIPRQPVAQPTATWCPIGTIPPEEEV